MERNFRETLTENQFAKMVKDSAHQIWLAGLGAFVKAQEEGNKFFESLVAEGEKVEARTKKVAEEKVEEVKHRSSDTWDKLEHVFEDRVSRALGRLGVPTNEDVQQLSKQIETLNKSIKELIEAGNNK